MVQKIVPGRPISSIFTLPASCIGSHISRTDFLQLYLSHAIVLISVFICRTRHGHFKLFFLPYELATLILATLMHKFVETPAIQIGGWMTTDHTLKEASTTVFFESSRAS